MKIEEGSYGLNINTGTYRCPICGFHISKQTSKSEGSYLF